MLIEGTSYLNRGIQVLTPTRSVQVHWQVAIKLLQLRFPLNTQRDFAIVANDEVAVAYNKLFRIAVSSEHTYALTLEDDMLPREESIIRLLDHLEAHPEYAAISALYMTKERFPVPIVLGNPQVPGDFAVRPLLDAKGLMEVNAIPMGCALWRLEMFRNLMFPDKGEGIKGTETSPWFATTTDTQDIFFARIARKAGYRFAVDLGLRCGHLDINTGKVY